MAVMGLGSCAVLEKGIQSVRACEQLIYQVSVKVKPEFHEELVFIWALTTARGGLLGADSCWYHLYELAMVASGRNLGYF
jgi:hypothetical protein